MNRKIYKSKFFNFILFFLIKFNYRLKNFLIERKKVFFTKLGEKEFQCFGPFSKINGEFKYVYPKLIFLGNNVHVGENSYLDGRGGILIGDNTHISRNVFIYTSNHNYEGEALPYDNRIYTKEVVIGSNVWIGMNVCITPGVNIGEGAVIGMGAVVSSDVKPGDIVGGNPNTIISKRDEKHYERLLEKKLYGGVSGDLLKKNCVNQFLISPLNTKEVYFVLSTGRSGSKTFTEMFNKDSDVSSFHETFHYLLSKLSIEFLTGKLDRENVKLRLLNFFKFSFIKQGTLYLESDQALVPFIDILTEIFPNPKFIWLVRNPKTFLHSAASRGWFLEEKNNFHKNKLLINSGGNIFATYRPTGSDVGQFSVSEWTLMSQEEKILWYWNYWNSTIEYELKTVSETNKILFKMEKLKYEVNKIYSFLNLEPKKEISVKKTNKVKKNDYKNYVESKSIIYDFFDKQGFKMVSDMNNKLGYSKK
ncbi:MAG: hypothetical protein GVY05_02065 [Bacteroidetes bacterium]|nr:hypothetical protein [Bacteroidota bacterium]